MKRTSFLGVEAAIVQEPAERSYAKVRGGGREELPRIQDKELWLHFAEAAVKRYPTSKVKETQVRW